MPTRRRAVKNNFRYVFGVGRMGRAASSANASPPPPTVRSCQVSRSPWKLLDRAVGDLEDFEALLTRFPDASARVQAALGEEGIARISSILAELRAASAQLREGANPHAASGDG